MVIEAQGGRCFRTPCPNCQRSRHTSVSGSAPTPRTGSVQGYDPLSDSAQIGPPLIRRGIPGSLRSAPEHERTSTPPTAVLHTPPCVPAGVVRCVSECTQYTIQRWRRDRSSGSAAGRGPDVHPPCMCRATLRRRWTAVAVTVLRCTLPLLSGLRSYTRLWPGVRSLEPETQVSVEGTSPNPTTPFHCRHRLLPPPGAAPPRLNHCSFQLGSSMASRPGPFRAMG